MHFYKIEYSRNPATMWKKLKTIEPTDRKNFKSLYKWAKSTSRYHFTDKEDLSSLDTDCPAVIPITRFDISDLPSIEMTQPATFAKRASTRKNNNNEMEEHDFRTWGYDIDGGYTILNRKSKPELPTSLQQQIDKLGFKDPHVRFDVQMPGQCFYWHIDAFGGILGKASKGEFSRGDFEKHSAADIDQRKIMRIVIFLEDQKLGHHWQQGNLYLRFQKGDVIAWPWRDVPHGTANYGHVPRPTVNVTGIVTDKTYEFLDGITQTNQTFI